MKSLHKLMILFIVFSNQLSMAQKESIFGLWEVEKVSMGGKSVTPIAKWARYSKKGTYESGNGWLKSIDGTWTFDSKSNVITSTDLLGFKDKLGGFKVSHQGKKMIWKRNEFGQVVTVLFKRIEKLPMAPSDYLEGVWINNDNPQEKLHFRWDRILVTYAKSSKSSSYWHINGHRPEITLLPHQKEGKVESWQIIVNDQNLTMKGVSITNKGLIKKYRRTNQL